MTNFTVRLDEKEKERLQEIAQEEGIHVSQIVRKLIRDYLKDKEKK